MNLTTICNEVAAKMLGNSNEVVECMNNVGFEHVFNVGQCYYAKTLTKNMCGETTLGFGNPYCNGYFATRFRKPK